MKMPELLSPAGNPEKMKSALRFGADAVYLSGKVFGMRAAADNFTVEEIAEACAYAHSLGKKVYVTVNTMPHTNEYPALERYLCELDGTGADALIVADPGVIDAAHRCAPSTALHLSTQAGAVSAQDCLFFARQGVSRVVLARELSFDDIADIRKAVGDALELEVFIHGSMCVSFSGRCMLSENMVGRDANRGVCAQPCRWNYGMYEIAEEKRPGMRMPIEQHPEGTFIMSSRDMSMIEHIPELVCCGVASLKIEGRMKSAYYAAVTANTYRMALDRYAACPEGYGTDAGWLRELDSVSHREYCTGYFFDKPSDNAQLTALPGYIKEKAFLATVTETRDGRAYCLQKNKAINGACAELLTPGRCGMPVILTDMRSADGQPIESSPHPGMIFSLDLPEAHPGDIIRGV